MKHHKYCHVKRVAAFHIGGLAACDGAWNRKYRVTSIEHVKEFPDYDEYKVGFLFLGHFYADGREVIPRRKLSPRYRRAFVSKGKEIVYVPGLTNNVARPQLNRAGILVAVEVK